MSECIFYFGLFICFIILLVGVPLAMGVGITMGYNISDELLGFNEACLEKGYSLESVGLLQSKVCYKLNGAIYEEVNFKIIQGKVVEVKK